MVDERRRRTRSRRAGLAKNDGEPASDPDFADESGRRIGGLDLKLRTADFGAFLVRMLKLLFIRIHSDGEELEYKPFLATAVFQIKS